MTRRVRRTTWLLGLMLLAQIMSCGASPTLALRPGAEVLGACTTWARPGPPYEATWWCDHGGQGSWSPTLWLVLAGGATLIAGLVMWAWPGAVLLSRLHDRRMASGPDQRTG